MILLRLESSKAKWTSRALSNIRRFDRRDVPKGVSFETEPGSPEIQASGVSKAGPGMEAKLRSSQCLVRRSMPSRNSVPEPADVFVSRIEACALLRIQLEYAGTAPPDSAIHVRLARGKLDAVVRQSSR
jgi:hypothetical protein